MSSTVDKIYVGSGKERKFDGGGSVINVTLDLDKLVAEYMNHGFKTNNGEKKIRITIGQRKEVGQYGDTHTVTLDTWHPATYVPPGVEESPMFENKEEKITNDEDVMF